MPKLSGQFSGFIFLTPSTIFDTVDHFSLIYFLYPSFKTLTSLYFLLYCSFQPVFVGFSRSPLLSVAELQSSVLCLFFFNCAHLFFGDFFGDLTQPHDFKYNLWASDSPIYIFSLGCRFAWPLPSVTWAEGDILYEFHSSKSWAS